MKVDRQKRDALIHACVQAGNVILQVRASGIEKMTKGDGSPVTEADQKGEKILLAALQEAYPDIAVIAEEAAEAGILPETGERFFLVDPLDGTKEFIRGGSDFTVNIGLIEHEKPVFGIVYAPMDGRLYVGEGQGSGWQANINCQDENPIIQDQKPLQVRTPVTGRLAAVASKSHRDEATNAWLLDRGITDIVSAGSSIKFCLIASGEADVYPRFGPTMEWDTAAAHAVLSGAGGAVTNIDGSEFKYGKRDQPRPYLNPGFIAWNGLRDQADQR